MSRLAILACLGLFVLPSSVYPQTPDPLDVMTTVDQAGRTCLISELTEVRLAIRVPDVYWLDQIRHRYDRLRQTVEARERQLARRQDREPRPLPQMPADPSVWKVMFWGWLYKSHLNNMDVGHVWIELFDHEGHQTNWDFGPAGNSFGTRASREGDVGTIRCNRPLVASHTLAFLAGPDTVDRIHEEIAKDMDQRLVFNCTGSVVGQNCLRWSVNILLRAGIELPPGMQKIHELGLATALNGAGLTWKKHDIPKKNGHP